MTDSRERLNKWRWRHCSISWYFPGEGSPCRPIINPCLPYWAEPDPNQLHVSCSGLWSVQLTKMGSLFSECKMNYVTWSKIFNEEMNRGRNMRMYNTELANKSYLFRISILPLHSSQKLKTIDFSEKLSTQKKYNN